MTSSVAQGAGRPVRGYRTADGTRIPSVTTITSRFKESGGLVHWAWQLGIDGEDYRQKRDSAASIGSVCHGFIERHVHGNPPTNEDFVGHEEATQGYLAFCEWAESVQLEVLETEFPLVSEMYRFGGTPDALALISGTPELLDYKSSNRVYPEYVQQAAAYRQLIRERPFLHSQPNQEAPRPDSAYLLRIGKEYGDFHVHRYSERVLDMGWRAFLLARELYEVDKELKKVAA